MELLYLLTFLTGWFVCWIQMSQSPKRLESPLSQQTYLTQLQLENQRLQSEIQKLKDSEMAQAQAREWDLQ